MAKKIENLNISQKEILENLLIEKEYEHPFLNECIRIFLSNYILNNEINTIDFDDFINFINLKKEDLKLYQENYKEYYNNISHRETDEIITNSTGNHKVILLKFIELIETYSINPKGSNQLVNYFNEQLYYLKLGIESPKFITEMYCSNVNKFTKLELKFWFYDCARAYIEMEYKSNKNDNYLIVYTILKAKSKQLKLQIESNKNGIKTVKNDIETTKTKQRNPIKWNGNINDLAYLFWSLSKAGVVNIDSFGIDLSTMFVDSENKEILNIMFNKYSSDFAKSKYPANAADIDTLVNILKYNIKK